MSTIRVSKRERFVMIDKTGVEDKRLSLKAKGMLLYLLSKPDDWTISSRQLANIGPDGRAAVLSALKDLEDAGYLVRKPCRLPNGRLGVEQVLYERPPGVLSEPGPGVISRSRKTEPLTKEGTTEEYPPTPAKRGKKASPRELGTNPRAKGTNPRSFAVQREAIRLTNDLRNCPECSDKSWQCLKCHGRERRIRELAG